MADDGKEQQPTTGSGSSILPNEFTLNDEWRTIGTTMGTNGLIGAGVGFLVSLVLLS